MTDDTVFPHPIYKETVLAPLFDGVKRHFADEMAKINRAHLVMLYETGILDRDKAVSIAGALKKIETESDLSACEYSGEFEDYFFLVEHYLREQLGADTAGMLHTARSRNDMDHTVFKMQLRSRCDVLLAQALTLASALIDKACQERDTAIVAYTHGQPAQPTTFGHYLGAVIEVLLSDITRLVESRRLLDSCPMGAAAITTTGFPIDRHRMAKLLGFKEPKRNSYACIASIDYISGLYSSIKLLFLHMGRVVQDMAFWSSFEVGQLYVPNSLVQISSIMPQKRNPVPIEHLRLLSSLTVGRCDTMVNTMHNTPFTDMNDSEGEVQSAGFAAFESGSRVLKLMTAFIQLVSINTANVKRNSDSACATVTELADTLVREEALSFRQAHEISANTARAVLEAGLPLDKGFDCFNHTFENAVGRAPSLDRRGFSQAVSIRAFIESRDRFGGPAPAALDEALNHYKGELAALRGSAESAASRSLVAQHELERTFEQLLEH